MATTRGGVVPRPGAARLVLMLAVLAAVAFAAVSPALLVDDSPGYLSPARSFASGDGLREADGSPLQGRLPLYPLVLGMVFFAFGASPTAIALCNAALHIGAVFLVRRPLSAVDPRLADAACATAVVYPPLLASTALILQESLLACTLALVFIAAWRALAAPSAGRSLAAGAAIGISALAKVTIVPLIVPLALGLATVARPRVRHAALACVGAFLVLLPWATRNALILGRFEVTNSNGGLALLGGTVSNTLTDWYAFPEYLAARSDWEAGERERYPVLDRYLYRRAFDRIWSDPLRWAGLAAGRLVRFMLPSRVWFSAMGLSRMGTVGPVYVVGILCQATLFTTTGLLLFRVLRRGGPAEWLVAPTIVFGHQIVYAVFYASPRYGVTVGPLLFASLVLLAARPLSTPRGERRPLRLPLGRPQLEDHQRE